MDERQSNLIRATAIAFCVLAGTTILFWYLIVPIMAEDQLKQFEDMNCDAPDVTCTVSPGLLSYIIAIPPIISLLVSLWYLEKKRLKTWRSWK